MSLGIVTFIFLLCSVRTNVVFVIIFLSLTMCIGFITGAYWQLAKDYAGNAAFAGKLLVVSSSLSNIHLIKTSSC